MNERIKEMWEEATVSVWPRPGKFTAGEYDYHLEKFAKLIVRECIEEFRGEVQHWYDWEVDDEMLEQVKKHFGVEE